MSIPVIEWLAVQSHVSGSLVFNNGTKKKLKKKPTLMFVLRNSRGLALSENGISRVFCVAHL